MQRMETLPPQYFPQPRSTLLQLPRELRDEIYSLVLGSTRVTFGEDEESNAAIKPTINKCQPYLLALLYTCRQINKEIGSLWVSWVLFNFQAPESLLDILTELPTKTIAAIRHIRVNGRPFMLSLPDGDVYYRLAWVMKLVPHLQLNTLTVLGGCATNIAGGSAQVDYDTLDDLIAHGTGWKELHYITPNSMFLGFHKTERNGKTYLRKPQPHTWISALYERDGSDSGASLIIYRSKISKPGCIINHLERETFEQVVASNDLEAFGLKKDPFLTSSSEKDKEGLVVVKRGRNANILEEVSKPPYDQNRDMRALGPKMTWKQIRHDYIEGRCDSDYNFEDNDDYGGFRFDSNYPFGQSSRTTVNVDDHGSNAHEINWADQIIQNQPEDWNERTALDLLRARIVEL